MLKVKISKIGLMILTSVFCLFLSGVAAEKECWDSLGGGPTFTGNHNYPSGWFPEFQYDPNNPDEIDRNSSVGISVIGGFPPYTWEVSGNGFILSLDETEDPSNALYADDSACGTATIEVIDNYGVPVTGYVRCTTGGWKCCGSTGVGGCTGGDEQTYYVSNVCKYTYTCSDNPSRGFVSSHHDCNEYEGVDCEGILDCSVLCENGKCCGCALYFWTCP